MIQIFLIWAVTTFHHVEPVIAEPVQVVIVLELDPIFIETVQIIRECMILSEYVVYRDSKRFYPEVWIL